MKNIDLSNYGPIIGSKTIGDEIYWLIKKEIDKGEQISISLKNIRSMATFCAKQIFGKLYVELGSQLFFEKILITGADNDLKTIIQIGIQHAIEESKK
jgi:hypothetical protein